MSLSMAPLPPALPWITRLTHSPGESARSRKYQIEIETSPVSCSAELTGRSTKPAGPSAIAAPRTPSVQPVSFSVRTSTVPVEVVVVPMFSSK